MSGPRSFWLAALLILLCAALLTFQVLIRPAVGIADNGDFPKMAGRLALAPETHEWANDSTVGFSYSYFLGIVCSDSYHSTCTRESSRVY